MPGGRAHHIWIIKNPQGREIAEAIGEGTAKKIVQALNAMENK
jgi:hypothetical protein